MPTRAWTRGSWYFLSGVDVYAPGASAVVAYGDSITDGNHSTTNANHRWPDYLAARLAADPVTQKAGILGVVNTGISGMGCVEPQRSQISHSLSRDHRH